MSHTKKDKLELAASERAEKLVSALYLVTGLLPEHEPIKNKLRSESLSLLSLCIENAQESTRDKGVVIKTLLRSLEEVTSLLLVAKISGTISTMNSELLVRGFETLRHFFEAKETSLYDGITPDVSPLALSQVEEETKEVSTWLSSKALGNNEDKVSGGAREIERSSTLENSRSSAPSDSKELGESSSSKVWMSRTVKEIPRGIFKARKVSRREQILGVFVRGRDISIKDISAKVKGCSEKTIQRELNTLVYDHLLERIGEKRWSRYVLR
jgi:hypothetical protein